MVIGGNGLVGKSIVDKLRLKNKNVISLDKDNYKEYIGKKTNVLINANGNSYRFKANNDPLWDYNSSVQSVLNTFKDFQYDLYIYVSTVDVYNDLNNPSNNSEKVSIEPSKLDYYGFHKWISERLVQKYCSNSIILRLGTILGKYLKKGPIYDLLNNNPLHMSIESQLTFIDTDIISRVLLGLIKMKKKNEIYNLTGSGFVKFDYLIDHYSFPSLVKKESKQKIYSYNINNQKITSLFELPTTREIVENFIKQEYKL